VTLVHPVKHRIRSFYYATFFFPNAFLAGFSQTACLNFTFSLCSCFYFDDLGPCLLFFILIFDRHSPPFHPQVISPAPLLIFSSILCLLLPCNPQRLDDSPFTLSVPSWCRPERTPFLFLLFKSGYVIIVCVFFPPHRFSGALHFLFLLLPHLPRPIGTWTFSCS